MIEYGKDNERLRMNRAIRYAKAIVALQNIGAGDDKNLPAVREIVFNMQALCEDETGIEVDSYPTKLAKEPEKADKGESKYEMPKM